MKRLSVNEVSEVLLSEKKTAKMTKLDPQWMIRLGDTLIFLGERRREALAEENGTAFEIYDDELRKIKKLRKQILEIRKKKIMSLAWSAREEVKPKTKHMLPSEKKLYQLLVVILREWRESLRDRTEFGPELVLDHDSKEFGAELGSLEDSDPLEPDGLVDHDQESGEILGQVEEAGPEEEYAPSAVQEPAAVVDEPGVVAEEDSSASAEPQVQPPAPQEQPEQKVLTVQEAEVSEEASVAVETGPEPEEPEDQSPSGSSEDAAEEKESPPQLITIGILSEELGSFLDASGKVYNLRKGELVHIPEEEAKLLIDNGLAREIGGSP